LGVDSVANDQKLQNKNPPNGLDAFNLVVRDSINFSSFRSKGRAHC